MRLSIAPVLLPPSLQLRTTPTSERYLGNSLSSSSLLSTSTQPVGITPAQLFTLLQLLSQTLQQNPSALPQQPSIPVAPLPQPCISSTHAIFPISLPPVFSVAQHGPATTQPTTLTSTISHTPLLSPQETNEDALSTASDILLPAATVPGEHTYPSVSLSLPPVPLAVQ